MLETIGKLRHFIEIVKRQQTPNSAGNIDYGHVVVARAWAYIEPKKGSQYLFDQQIDRAMTHQILIRYNRFVDSEMWVNYRQQSFMTNLSTANSSLAQLKTFRIRSVKNLYQLQRFQILECEEYFQT